MVLFSQARSTYKLKEKKKKTAPSFKESQEETSKECRAKHALIIPQQKVRCSPKWLFPQRLLCKVSSLVFLVSGGNRPVAAVIMINLLCPHRRGCKPPPHRPPSKMLLQGMVKEGGIGLRTQRWWPQHGVINHRYTGWKWSVLALTWAKRPL